MFSFRAATINGSEHQLEQHASGNGISVTHFLHRALMQCHRNVLWLTNEIGSEPFPRSSITTFHILDHFRDNLLPKIRRALVSHCRQMDSPYGGEGVYYLTG